MKDYDYTVAQAYELVASCPVCCAGSSAVVAPPPSPPSCAGENPTFTDANGDSCAAWEGHDCAAYPYFTRVTPSDARAALALVTTLVDNSWMRCFVLAREGTCHGGLFTDIF